MPGNLQGGKTTINFAPSRERQRGGDTLTLCIGGQYRDTSNFFSDIYQIIYIQFVDIALKVYEKILKIG